ncbi:4-amino-4-deoxy-L-arabinose-phosphoundecaprenol flippase subunit ArnF [uncultured Shewanella sp.]|uniref:4-amino-4-deoxy-L-arabinose-phosphoundecaprenol flippase subunit ArnF n=1 Tax=uncultured Shewanella sp. TaxID=173975 RepID=UPI0026234B25|nr:4-amino-4-deoxy-L-arabinose-phosphoundecaprenol flippase subunit ArnF [uncultured Shewanella sp.]
MKSPQGTAQNIDPNRALSREQKNNKSGNVPSQVNKVSGALVMALACVFLISAAQLMMKWGVMQLPSLPPELRTLWQQAPLFSIDLTSITTPIAMLLQTMQIPILFIISGLFCYALSMICWIIALKQLPLSVAYPLLSLSYIIVYFAAIQLPWLNETFSAIKFLGVIFILIGLFLMAPKKNNH